MKPPNLSKAENVAGLMIFRLIYLFGIYPFASFVRTAIKTVISYIF